MDWNGANGSAFAAIGLSIDETYRRLERSALCCPSISDGGNRDSSRYVVWHLQRPVYCPYEARIQVEVGKHLVRLHFSRVRTDAVQFCVGQRRRLARDYYSLSFQSSLVGNCIRVRVGFRRYLFRQKR